MVGAYFGLHYAEGVVLEEAERVNAELQCCAGPQAPRDELRQSRAADECPEALRNLRRVSYGVGDPAARARQLLGGNCPGAAVAWAKSAALAVTPPPRAPPPP